MTPVAKAPSGAATASEPGGIRPRVALTIGKLDGLHAGHRHLLAHVLSEADARNVHSAALVLHPDPRQVLRGVEVPVLSTVGERVARARAFGVDIAEPLQFTVELAAVEPARFLAFLAERFDIAALVVGPDFAFGRNRSGSLDTLSGLARAGGFDVVVAEPLDAEGEWVSSRRVRSLVQAGDIALARSLLRAPPRVVGTVVHGAARGRSLGFPTANLDLIADFAVPANGIYAVRAAWKGPGGVRRGTADGVASIGVRPTFDNGARLVEVHLLDFDGDLYGTEMTVDFLVRQRDELRFEDTEALIDQMVADAEEARRHLRRERAASEPRLESPGRVVATGRDLADVAERLAGRAMGTAAGEGGAGRRCVSVRGSSEAEVLDAWLAALRPIRSAAGGSVRTSVYRAGPRVLDAVAASAPGATEELAATRLVGLRRDGDWLEATAELATGSPDA